MIRPLDKDPRPFRSFLFAPCRSVSLLTRGFNSGADVVIPDLEDSLEGPVAKDQGLQVLLRFLEGLTEGGPLVIPRLNDLSSPSMLTKLETLARAQVNGFLIPKVNTADDLQTVDEQLGNLEKAHGFHAGQFSLWALIETPKGVSNLSRIAQATPRLQGLVFGSEDLLSYMHASHLLPLEFLRSVAVDLVIRCRANDLIAVDTVHLDRSSLEGVGRRAAYSSSLGFDGMLAIHPEQIAPINANFPSDDDRNWAARVLDSAGGNSRQETGVFQKGSMIIGPPMLRSARRIDLESRDL